MMMFVNMLITAAASYVLGSIPTAYIFGKIFKGIDIRKHGSGNVGATNAFRVFGKSLGTAVLVLDIIKGIVPVVVFGVIFPGDVNIPVIAAIMAVVGHNWTCFLQFQGGKGIATSLGVLIGLTVALPSIRLAVFLCILLWVLCFLLTAYISVSSILTGLLLPVLMVVFDAPISVKALSIIFCVFVVLRHRPNIHRLLQGQESKVPLPFHKK